jgi:hypothetical protein
MSEESGGGAVAPAATTSPAAVTPPVASAPKPATPQPGDEEQPWFKERLSRAEQQAREKLLTELGVKDPEKAKAAILAAAKAEEDAKTTGEKLGTATKRVEELEAEAAELRGTVATVAAGRLAALTEDQRKAVVDLAGDDASAQIIAINALEPTWAAASTPKPAATTAKKPATTAPTPNAPPTETTSPPDHKAIHAQLKKTNPHAAAVYLNAHHSQIYPRA